MTGICTEGHETILWSERPQEEHGKKDKTIRSVTKISGVTYANQDGTSRQELLKHVAAGDTITLYEGEIDGKKVVFARHAIGTLGTIKRDTAKAVLEAAPSLDSIRGIVLQCTGGQGSKTTRGCNVMLTYTPDTASEETEPQPTQEPSEQTTTQPSPAIPPEIGRRTVYMDPDGRNIFHLDARCSGMKNAEKTTYYRAKTILHARACKKCAALAQKWS